MSVLKTNKIDQSLLKKGFNKVVDKDHIFYYFYFNGKKSSIYTKVSHGENEISDELIGEMAKQTRLKNNEFKNLINCSLSHKKYIELLLQRKQVS